MRALSAFRFPISNKGGTLGSNAALSLLTIVCIERRVKNRNTRLKNGNSKFNGHERGESGASERLRWHQIMLGSLGQVRSRGAIQTMPCPKDPPCLFECRPERYL